MNPRAPLDPRLLEDLSAYLDGNLTGAELAALEERLKREEDLRLQLAELRAVRESLRALPVLKPPRPLTLSRAQAGEPARQPGAPSTRWMAFGSAFAAVAFVCLALVNFFGSRATMGASMKAFPESYAFPAEATSASAGAAEGAVEPPAPTLAKEPSLAQPTYTTPLPTGGRSQEPETVEPTSTLFLTPEAQGGGCDEDLVGVNRAYDKCGLKQGLTEPTTAFSFPSFQDLVPYLAAVLGIAAIVLAVLAFYFRKRR